MAKLTIPAKGATDTVSYVEFNAIVDSINSLYNNPEGQKQWDFAELDVVHTNGIGDHLAGTDVYTASFADAAVSGGNLVLTPSSDYWKSLDFAALAVSVRVDSNVLPGDLSGSGPSNEVIVSMYQAYLTSGSVSTVGQRQTIFMAVEGTATNGGPAPTGVLNSPALIGDTGTLYGQDVCDLVANSPAVYQIGIGGDYSRYYFIFTVSIPASAASKTYKFKISLKYQ